MTRHAPGPPLPCHRCGGGHISTVTRKEPPPNKKKVHGYYYAIHCGDCDYIGPWHTTQHRAIAEWNGHFYYAESITGVARERMMKLERENAALRRLLIRWDFFMATLLRSEDYTL